MLLQKQSLTFKDFLMSSGELLFASVKYSVRCKMSIFTCNECHQLLIRAGFKNCSFWKCELMPSKHACKIFFNYSKLCVISCFAKKVHFLSPKHASQCFSNEFSQHHWQESFDCDSFVDQSRYDAYAGLIEVHKHL